MGHTVVLGLTNTDSERIHKLLQPFEPNKIPFGRKCNRDKADHAMDYHMTLYHWPKTMDEYCLSRIKGFRSVPCRITVLGTHIMPAEENSWLLYFEITPTQTFLRLKTLFESHTGFSVSGFYHITLAVSKDYKAISEMNDHICRNVVFPFELTSDRLDVYKIWTPTERMMSL